MNKSPKEIRIEEFNYPLPDNRIAKYPLKNRDESKLLLWKDTKVSHAQFYNLPDYLPKDSLLVYNNTKVIQARLHFKKTTGASIEIFCLEPVSPADYEQNFQSTQTCIWKCLVGNLKKWKEGKLFQEVTINDKVFQFSADRISSDKGMSHQVQFSWNNPDITFIELLQHFGELPIPPYLNRKTEESDLTTYQTVYSKIDGSVAAPTAGLHFTQNVLNELIKKGIREDEVTLHVGAGTFAPVKAIEIGDHPMHKEIISVKRATLVDIQKSIGKIVAVGTTSVRTLESLYYLGCHIQQDKLQPNLLVDQWEPYDFDHQLSVEDSFQYIIDYLDANKLDSIEAATQIMIVPSFQFRVVTRIITNFHQPKSTLLLLISAFVGLENWTTIYDYALNNEFRFLSYGDSSLLSRD